MDSTDIKIKGAVIKDPRNWTQTAYGAEAYQTALSKLSPEDRAFVEGPLLSGAWYSIAPWDRFLAAMRDEARARKGHSAEQFNMRNIREAGSSTLRSVYKFILGLMNPRSVIDKAVVLYGRAYSEGRCEVVSNAPGLATLRYSGARPALRTNLTNHFVPGMVFVLELNGAKEVSGSVTRDEIVDGKVVFEVTLKYR